MLTIDVAEDVLVAADHSDMRRARCGGRAGGGARAGRRTAMLIKLGEVVAEGEMSTSLYV